MNKIQLNKTLSRVFFPCTIAGKNHLVLFDPGSPNSIVPLALASKLGLKSVGVQTSIKIVGETVSVVPVVIPSITLGTTTISDVRVVAGLDAKVWKKTIILGLNVLNYFKYTVDRETDPGQIVLEMNGRVAPRSTGRSKFNHLLSNNGYYIK
jgi:hypothetical protein